LDAVLRQDVERSAERIGKFNGVGAVDQKMPV
jgi:hypothetical protein